MRRLKTLLCLGFAALAVGALAVPGVASAAEWKHDGQPLTEAQSIELSGSVKLVDVDIDNGWARAELTCGASGAATLEPGDEGEITEFAYNPSSCEASGNLLSGCQVVDVQTTAPWSIDLSDSQHVTIDDTHTWVEFDGECTYMSELETEGDITATLDSAESMSSWSLSGDQAAILFGLEYESPVAGELDVAFEGGGSEGGGEGPGGSGEIGLGGPVTLLDFDDGWVQAELICSASGKATLAPGDEGEITEFSYNPSSCQASGNLLSGCEVVDVQTTAPWSIDASDPEDVTIDDTRTWVEFDGECTYVSELETEGDITVTPDDTEAMSSWSLSGDQTASILGLEYESSLSGQLSVTPAGVYGIDG